MAEIPIRTPRPGDDSVEPEMKPLSRPASPRPVYRRVKRPGGGGWVLKIVLFFLAMIAIGATYGVMHRRALEKNCNDLAAWIETRHPPGAYPAIELPGQFRDLAINHTVNAVVFSSGRVVLLLRTSDGWQGHWKGIVYSTTPLQTQDIASDSQGGPRVNVQGLADHVLTGRTTPRLYQIEAPGDQHPATTTQRTRQVDPGARH
jgi:hypothetical protein